ncbi:hypothetical protein [Hymenobacter defluvii]|nr:hypothetical protein [Hymenobacter defluvii]
MFSTFELSTFLQITAQGFFGGLIICAGLKEFFGFRFNKRNEDN